MNYRTELARNSFVANNLGKYILVGGKGNMKRWSILLVVITIALLYLQTGVSGAAIEPVYLSPLPNAELVQTETTITVRFAEDVAAGSMTDVSMIVRGSSSGAHKGTSILARDKRTVIFKPNVPFMPGETVSVRLNPGLVSTSGSNLYMEDFSFTVSPGGQKEDSAAVFSLPEDTMGMGPATTVPSFISRSSDSFVTVPSSFPEMTVTVPANGTGDGYIFLSNFTVDWTDRGVSKSTPYLLILDNEGEPVFYRNMGKGRPTLDFKKQPNGLLTYGVWADKFYGMDSSYNIVKSYEAGNGYRIDIHDLQIIANDHVLLMIYDTQPVDMRPYGGLPDAMVTGLVLQELDVDGNVVFQWRSWDHFELTDSVIDLTQANIDYVHGNAIELDLDGNLLISSRNLDEITKIDRQTGDVIWRLGGKNNEFTFVNDPEPFFAQHDIRRLDNGNITIFDNRAGPGSTFARAVEYELDETNMIATLVWEHRNDRMSPAMGNAQRLSNNNTMIGWGSVYPSLTEVKPNGEVAFELSFVPYAEPNLLRNSYRAFRFEWEGNPTTKPLLVARNETPGITTLYTSWNGATNIGKYQVFAGETADDMMPLYSMERDGFETEISIADGAEQYCYFRVMPITKEDKQTQFSNLALAEHCVAGQFYSPVIAIPGN